MFLIFDSCKADLKGNCNLTGKIEMFDPDGGTYGDTLNIKVWDNQPAPKPRLLILSPAGMGLVIEDGEKMGNYNIRISVTDTIAGVTAQTQEIITVTEAVKK